MKDLGLGLRIKGLGISLGQLGLVHIRALQERTHSDANSDSPSGPRLTTSNLLAVFLD